jgi:L-asparaginase
MEPELRLEADAAVNAMVPVPLIQRDSAGATRYTQGGPGRVLLIYTGGTMGMTMQNGTLAPLKGYLPQRVTEMPEMHDDSMPELDVLEYDPLIDSSNVGPSDWAMLASQVRDHYYDYDGFVIVHGTDTMAYTASALSFMLEGLGKAVVITGSMIPLAAVYSDARRNLLISMIFAAQLDLCEVAIFFNDQLLRGNRAVKSDSNGLDAFSSPNFPPLATVGARISADRSKWRAPPISRLRVHTDMETSIVVLRCVPGFDDSAIGAMVRHSASLRCIVLSLYGTGNGPSAKAP